MVVQHSTIATRLIELRRLMSQNGWDAVLIPSSDPHLSEYLPAHWQGREWFSGFTGSMGTLVVGTEQAALFADGRYWVQAEAELAGTGVSLEKIPTGTSTLHLDWLASHLQAGQTLAVDGKVLSLAAAKQLKSLAQTHGLNLQTHQDPLDDAWPGRPGLPTAAIYEFTLPMAARTRASKLAMVRQEMARLGVSHHLISTLDDIAWLTNLRGADVEYNPVFLAHLILGLQEGMLFVGQGKLAPELVAALAHDGISIADYNAILPRLAALPTGSRLLIDPKRITLGLRDAVPPEVELCEAINPSVLAKSCKVEAEAAYVRKAMIEDGAAMCRFYAWFEAALAAGEPVTELTVDERLSAERARQPGFIGLSFPTIAAFNANGAMPHYRATVQSHAEIKGDGLLLIDSGGQYLGGTTDITRVWPIGQISAEQRRDYTLVLKGTMALSRARFPRGTLSPMLDALARAPLWAESLEYGHGTGHGIGYFLNVHEGPQSISKAIAEPQMAMLPGMITSIEPGLYRPGRWGIRIENLVLNVAAPSSEFGEFLEFETLTLCPIDTRCLDLALLRADEIQWLNQYHAMVRERLAPKLEGEALAWLMERTEKVVA